MDGTEVINLYRNFPITRHGVTFVLISSVESVSLKIAPAKPGEEFDGSGCLNPTQLICARQIRGARK